MYLFYRRRRPDVATYASRMGDLFDRIASWAQRRVEDDASAGPQPLSSPATRSAVDQRVAHLVEDRLRVHGNTTASVSQEWGAAAGMWFVEVTPAETEAAFVSVAFDGWDLLSIVIGRTCFEMFPVDDDALQELSGLLDAVFAGQVVEHGLPNHTAATIGIGNSRIKVGSWPAESCPEHRYSAYEGMTPGAAVSSLA